MNEVNHKQQQQGNNTTALRNKASVGKRMRREGWKSVKREGITYAKAITNNKEEHAEESKRDWRIRQQEANRKGEVKKDVGMIIKVIVEEMTWGIKGFTEFARN